MTWAYGASPRTLGEKFRDHLESEFPSSQIPWVSGTLSEGLEQVLKDDLPEVYGLREWMQKAAADRERAFEWIVPLAEFPAWMRKARAHERVEQIEGEINGAPVYPSVRLGQRFNPAKHKTAFMPNYIHSLDAAVVHIAIDQLALDNRVTHLGATHDGV